MDTIRDYDHLCSQGRGDVKKAGRPDPYAYIPLSHKSLNKRKQAKAKGQFNTVVKAARWVHISYIFSMIFFL
jgi:ribosomal RNA-processing protein 12